ncbi:hypothetical protein SKAU_G00387660 [Synaphobranchus kaupii]|uniref:Uncharacterized protein n=1 Tax=Synaphobranchus kaupii TaxID=118154 RepID=A0A9Q1EAY1_SYNKA|nr:hypothetical protein SKAU_G00387660 [Synaphobranchus kaupii]
MTPTPSWVREGPFSAQGPLGTCPDCPYGRSGLAEQFRFWAKAPIGDLEVELPVNNRSYCPPNAIDSEDVNGNVVEGSWRQEEERSCLQDIPRVGANTFGADASAIRQNLKNYFISEAGVPWQWEHVRRT